ncbi:MAG: rod shape-determining protein MreD [Pseudomonadota bacterium]
MAGPRDRAWVGPVALIIALGLSAQPLPGWMAPARPDWVALVLIYLGIHTPQRLVLVQAVVAGLLLDALQGTPLGQHVLALVLCCYLPLKLHLRLMLVPIWQTMLLTAVFTAIYQFVMFWINGATGNDIGAAFYLWPLASNAIVWPLLLTLLDVARLGRRSSD